MKIVSAVFLVFALASVTACTATEKVECQGLYHQAVSGTTEVSSRAALGFSIQRASLISKLLSPKDWKGFVEVSYSSEPYGETYSGGGVLQIKDDNDFQLAADNLKGDTGATLAYDPISGTGRFEEQENGESRTFSGLCRRGGDA